MAVGDRVTVCVRPEHLRLVERRATGLAGMVEMGLPLGATIVHEIRTADGRAIKVIRAARGRRASRARPARAVRVLPVAAEVVGVFPAAPLSSCTSNPITDHRERDHELHAARLLLGALALGAMQLFPGLTRAQAKRLVFATFTGSWEEAHRDVLVPAFRKATSNADIVLDPMLSVDQIAKVTAARTNPPIDVMLHDPGPALVAIAQGPRRAVSGRRRARITRT